MKQRKANFMEHRGLIKVMVIIVFGLICACAEYGRNTYEVFFESAQPAHKNPRKQFDKGIQGTYLETTTDRKGWVIANNQIVRFYIWKAAITIDSLKTSNPGATLEVIKISMEKDGYEFYIENNTVHYYKKHQDTIFQISKENELKKFRGKYFLNRKIKEGKWEVNLVCLEGDSLIIKTIASKNKLDSLAFVQVNRNVDEDGFTHTEYLLHPNKKDWKEQWDREVFVDKRVYQKK